MRIVVDPDTVVGTRNVTVYLDGTQVVQIPAPPELLAATTFKFGFSGSIGSAKDSHDIWNANIESVTRSRRSPRSSRSPGAAGRGDARVHGLNGSAP